MQSISKTPVSNELAQKIVKAHFGIDTCLSEFYELTEGFYNAAYFMQLGDGRKCVLKVAPPDSLRVLRYEKNILRAEVESLRLAKAHTSIPVPDVLAHDESGIFLPNPYFIMNFIPGVTLHKIRAELAGEIQAGIDQATGRYLRELNAISNTHFGYFAQPSLRYPSWRDAFDMMLKNVLLDGQEIGVVFPWRYEDILQRCQRHYASLEEVEHPSLVHWDLWDGNIFVVQETGQISGVIDFERVLWADPLMEVNFGAFGVNPEFIRGYGIELPFSETQMTRRTLYNVYLFLIMVIECTYRQYPTHDQENWARQMLTNEMEKLA